MDDLLYLIQTCIALRRGKARQTLLETASLSPRLYQEVAAP